MTRPTTEITEMYICEASRVVLHPDQLYRFTIAPGCQLCEIEAGIKPRPTPVPVPVSVGTLTPEKAVVAARNVGVAATTTNHGLDTDERVFFYERDFYVLSNFSAFRLRWRGHNFDTSEAAYQWSKFHAVQHSAICVSIREAPSAHEAFKIAERNAQHRIPDWDLVRVDTMRSILRAKIDQHAYVRHKLLATGERPLIEDSWRDAFWGWGPRCDGENMLGKLWMEIRAELRQQTPVRQQAPVGQQVPVRQPATVGQQKSGVLGPSSTTVLGANLMVTPLSDDVNQSGRDGVPPFLTSGQVAVLARCFRIDSGELQRRVISGDEDDHLAEMVDAYDAYFVMCRAKLGHNQVPIATWETYTGIKCRKAFVDVCGSLSPRV
jgi:ribA/ribD-fused uncharacterized protein